MCYAQRCVALIARGPPCLGRVTLPALTGIAGGALPAARGGGTALQKRRAICDFIVNEAYLHPVPENIRRDARNKREVKNAMARAVFFDRLGEMRDRTFENQRYRASGLNLVVAAIILWNTVYLERAIRLLQQMGRSISNFVLLVAYPRLRLSPFQSRL